MSGNCDSHLRLLIFRFPADYTSGSKGDCYAESDNTTRPQQSIANGDARGLLCCWLGHHAKVGNPNSNA